MSPAIQLTNSQLPNYPTSVISDCETVFICEVLIQQEFYASAKI